MFLLMFANNNVANFLAHERHSHDPLSGATSGIHKKKNKVAKKKEKDNESSEIKGAVYEITYSLREGNTIMRKCNNYKLPPI